MTVSGNQDDPTRGSLTILHDPASNLPTSIDYCYNSVNTALNTLSATLSTVDNANQNLSEPQKEVL
jgi:hypothetical protein